MIDDDDSSIITRSGHRDIWRQSECHENVQLIGDLSEWLYEPLTLTGELVKKKERFVKNANF